MNVSSGRGGGRYEHDHLELPSSVTEVQLTY